MKKSAQQSEATPKCDKNCLETWTHFWILLQIHSFMPWNPKMIT